METIKIYFQGADGKMNLIENEVKIPSGVTIKDMCETIEKAHIFENEDGTSPTAQEIFNYSPSGQLYMIFEWYKIALSVLEEKQNP